MILLRQNDMLQLLLYCGARGKHLIGTLNMVLPSFLFRFESLPPRTRSATFTDIFTRRSNEGAAPYRFWAYRTPCILYLNDTIGSHMPRKQLHPSLNPFSTHLLRYHQADIYLCIGCLRTLLAGRAVSSQCKIDHD